MSPRLVSVSAIVVNEGGWCSGKNIKSGSKKTRIQDTALPQRYPRTLSKFAKFISFFFFWHIPCFSFHPGSCIEYKLTDYDL